MTDVEPAKSPGQGGACSGTPWQDPAQKPFIELNAEMAPQCESITEKKDPLCD